MQLQADVPGRPVIRGEVVETGALGVAAMAFEALEISAARGEGQATTFAPAMDPARREALLRGWLRAVAQVLGS